MDNNIKALPIFPNIKNDLENKLAQIKTDMQAISAKTKSSDKTTLFAMMVNPTTLSVFNANSRFYMLYEKFDFTLADDDRI